MDPKTIISNGNEEYEVEVVLNWREEITEDAEFEIIEPKQLPDANSQGQ